MIKLYLIVNAISYLVFALWCLLKPMETSQNLGYSFLNTSGRTEYTSVYVGMELGFAAFFAFCAFCPEYMRAGLLFAVCLYIGLILVRTIAIFSFGNITKTIYIIGALEYIFGILGCILLYDQLKDN